MQIVIEISKEDYDSIKYNTNKSGSDYLILNGRILPTGHGRLIAERVKEYRESWKRLEEEMNKLDPDNDSFSVKNNACLLVKQYKPKDNDNK